MFNGKPSPHLPAEVLWNIFNRLGNKDLISSAQVNELWYSGATMILWSRTPLEINSRSVLKCLDCMPESRRKTHISYVRELQLEMSGHCWVMDPEPQIALNIQSYSESSTTTFRRLMDDLKSSNLRSIKISTIRNASPEQGYTDRLEDILKTVLLGTGPKVKELVFDGTSSSSRSVGKILYNQLCLPISDITNLTLTMQSFYSRATVGLELIPKLRKFVCIMKPDFRESGDLMGDYSIWILLRGLSKFDILDSVVIDGLEGCHKTKDHNSLIRAKHVSWTHATFEVARQALKMLDKSVLRELHLGLTPSLEDVSDLSTVLESLTLESTEHSSELIELSIELQPDDEISCYEDEEDDMYAINSMTLVGVAEGNPKLQAFTLGADDKMLVKLTQVKGADMERFARALPDLRSYVAHIHPESENENAIINSTVSLGRWCRHLSLLKASIMFDITTEDFRRAAERLSVDGFCLFPELKQLEMVFINTRNSLPTHRPEELEATVQEKEAFLSLLAHHFPKLATFSRSWSYNNQVFTCQLDDTNQPSGSWPVERFLFPYFNRNAFKYRP